MDQMNLSAEDCLAFEDSENGLLSSLRSNLKTVVTVSAYTRQQDFSGAAIVLDQLGEPGAPFSVMSGNAGRATYVDIAFIKRIFDA